MVDEAVASSATLIARLATLSAQRSDETAKVLHELKGSSRTIGAEELGALSEQAEELARAGRWEELSMSLAGLRGAHGRFAAAAASLGDHMGGSE